MITRKKNILVNKLNVMITAISDDDVKTTTIEPATKQKWRAIPNISHGNWKNGSVH